MGRKSYSLLLAAFLLPLLALAQGPNNSGTYYQNADGRKGKALKTALYTIISNHTVISYSGLWEAYKKTDLRPDGKIWDMYSNCTNFHPDNDRAGNYKTEGDVFNREHSLPKSWFDDASPMYSDIMHVVPTDGYVNGRRSNYPFGENRGEKYSSNGGFSKLGACTVSGYSGLVFEPNDEYKGDFARIYFYMATCYENKIANWGSDAISGDSYQPYATWYMNMLLRWAKNDPVSQKEIDRNNAVYGVQKNRNPFVDYPGLEDYVWGDLADVAFSYDNYTHDDSGTGGGGTGGEGGGESGGEGGGEGGGESGGGTEPIVPDITGASPAGSTQTYMLISSEESLQDGGAYIIVCPEKEVALSRVMSTGKAYECDNVTISGNAITTSVNTETGVHEVILCGTVDNYRLIDAVTGQALGLSKSDNALNSIEYSDELGDGWKWTIEFNGSEAIITNKEYSDRTIRYNTSSPRFACYKNGQAAVELFARKADTDDITVLVIDPATHADSVIYTVNGCRVSRAASPGLYIVNGRKMIVRPN